MTFCNFFRNSNNLAILFLFIAQKVVKAQIIVNILEQMLPSSEKNNFIDFLIKLNFTDFLSKYNQKCHENRGQN